MVVKKVVRVYENAGSGSWNGIDDTLYPNLNGSRCCPRIGRQYPHDRPIPSTDNYENGYSEQKYNNIRHNKLLSTQLKLDGSSIKRWGAANHIAAFVREEAVLNAGGACEPTTASEKEITKEDEAIR